MRNEEEKYLELVLEKVRNKYAEVCQKLGDNAKDMESMNDYFWENYTEFDEYGYEMFDNKMALKTRLTQQEEYRRDKKRYEKMMEAPYFGRVDFCYEGEEEPEIYYVGVGNLTENHAAGAYVYDWRAPVSGLFYDYDKGKAGFMAPIGWIEGEITRKRQYKIRDGKLVFALETEMNIDDEILQQALSENADSKLKSIVTTIQKEQNSIIRDRKHRMLVVQGCAGSGKTSVALHRIAYLLYHNRETLKAAQVLVLSPNSIFGDYISRILPELGEENICEMTLDDYAYRELQPYGEAQDKYDELEAVLHGRAQGEADYKQTKEYVQEIDLFLMQQEWENVDIQDFKYKKIFCPEEQISRLFYEKYCDVPMLGRLEKIAEYLIDEQETIQNRDMEEEEKQKILEKINRMYVTTDPVELYNRFLTESGREEQLVTGETIPYEDVYPLLYLKYSMNELPKRRKVKHVVIDEMQDYSYIQYRILQKLFDCPMTILGDRKQTMGEKQQNVMTFLPEIFGKEIFYIDMKKSYRSTCEIMEYASQIAPEHGDTEYVNRHGEHPCVECIDTEEELYERLAGELREKRACQTQGILCLTQEEADTIHKGLLERGIQADRLTKDSMKFHTGISVMPFYLAKGLEFDAVYIPHMEQYRSALEKQALYINVTRALHQLKLYQIEKSES